MEAPIYELPKILRDLLGGYACNLPPKFLVFPRDVGPSDVQDFLVGSILLNAHLHSYPASEQYQYIFWKGMRYSISALDVVMLISQLGCKDIELDSRIYEGYISLMPTTASQQNAGMALPKPSYITYFWLDSSRSQYERCTLLESRKLIEDGTTGLTTWPASMVLAQYLTSNADFIEGKSALELGCGIGLLGMVIATMQSRRTAASTLCLTDVRPDVLQRCEENLALECNASSSHPSLTCRLLDWTDALERQTVQTVHDLLAEVEPELIVGADIVFDPVIIPALVATLAICLTGRKTLAFLALTVRNATTIAEFLRATREVLTMEEIMFDPGESMFAGTSGKTTVHEVKIFRIGYSQITSK
ncbi:hypothetical protein EIP91_007282 [Steccherinum ochraceum]|uniref:Uncharacterized protein n=1 Tax=Steccherinum ochraceum TaxID=92696 RepID=A0A4R0RIM5_9APHY|nr:hypothetical protein EIP91_007282 [Steccherinum ochraceum]